MSTLVRFYKSNVELNLLDDMRAFDRLYRAALSEASGKSYNYLHSSCLDCQKRLSMELP